MLEMAGGRTGRQARLGIERWWRAPATVPVALAAIVAVAVLARLAAAGRSLWLDETITALKASRPTQEMLAGLAHDVHPPLYYLAVDGWAALAGTSELGLRSLSIAWSAVAVVAVWGWSRAAFPRSSGLAAALLAACAPFALWYGSEARPYAQLMALTALAGWAAWRILGDGASPRRGLGLLLALAGALWTHYTGALFVVALGAVALALAVVRPDRRRAAAWVLAACALAGTLLLPWVVWIALSGPLPTTTDYPRPDLYGALIVGLQLVVGFHPFALLGLLAAAWPLLGLAALAGLGRMGAVGWRGGGLLALIALPPAMLAASSWLGPRSAFDPRFVVVCAPPLCVAVAALAESVPRPRVAAAGLAAVAVLALAAGVRQGFDDANPKLYELREAVATANRLARPGDALVMVPQLNTAVDGERSLDPVTAYYRPAAPLRRLELDSTADVAALWRARPRRVLAIYGFERAGGDTPAGRRTAAQRRALERHSRATRTLRFANVTLRVHTLKGPPA